ncbi:MULTISPECIES: LLM class flavin-dependent oxidoreductase [unclassified Rathayibacter]|uniref:LLM class flavin-dependent oxidoreductase n=1 Tax=unclassified Rathayibacter TaxID=2609250 RepID=UPI000CE74E00|nr:MULTISPECIES: LLM class flavin-dependent oxidoreductase [unclassified Rathayibacter]PPI41098.1 hypothetical protein C5D50_03055 [Rathayibacter sp. RFBD1]PPI62000.1 hypothetical protein C5D38_02615 [Rathayibacter sp. TRS19]
MDVGVMYPKMPTTLGGVLPYADLARRHGGRLWFGHSDAVDSLTMMAALAGRGAAIPLGTAVTLHPLWSPSALARQALSISRLSGASVVLGIGPGGARFQESALGAPLARPVAETERFARQVLAVTEHSPAAVQLGFGVLRPAMAEAAGRAASHAITWLTPGSWIRDSIAPALARGAASSERPVPHLEAVVHVGVRRPGRDPVSLVDSAVHAHLAAPHYRDMLRRAGIDLPDDGRGAARAVVDQGVYLFGSPEEIADGLELLHADGADEVVVNVFGVLASHGEAAALADLEEVLAVLTERRIARERARTEALDSFLAGAEDVLA